AAVGNVAVRRAGLRGPAAEAAVGLGSAAVAVEVFAWGERHPHSAFTRMMRRPGFEIQRVVGTREPTEDQLEVGRAALEESLRVEQGAPARSSRWSWQESWACSRPPPAPACCASARAGAIARTPLRPRTWRSWTPRTGTRSGSPPAQY